MFEKYVIADAAAKLRQSVAHADNFLSVSKVPNSGVFVWGRQGSSTEFPAALPFIECPRSNQSPDRTPVATAALRGQARGGAGQFSRYAALLQEVLDIP